MEAPIMVPFKIGITACFSIVVLGYRIVYRSAADYISDQWDRKTKIFRNMHGAAVVHTYSVLLLSLFVFVDLCFLLSCLFCALLYKLFSLSLYGFYLNIMYCWLQIKADMERKSSEKEVIVMDKKFLKTYFLCVVTTLLLIFLLWNWKGAADFLGFVLHAFRPVIIGMVFAIILNRPFLKVCRLYCWSFPRLNPKIVNVLALITLYLLTFGAVAAIMGFIIPQLWESMNLFADNMEAYYNNMKQLTVGALTFGGHNWWEELELEKRLTELAGQLPTILQKMFSGLAAGITGVVGTITDCVIGLVISIYGLAQKKQLLAHASRVLHAFFKEKQYQKIIEILSLSVNTFSGFFSGQLTEAVILGILCFAGMKMFGFEYALLISVIAAISNLIPIVGPIVGTIPGALMLFLVKPSQAVWFLVFIIVLQQIEANIIYPRVVGSSVGLPAIWVLISVVVGGGLFGLLGMLFAIPVVSVLYELLKRYVGRKVPKQEREDRNKELILFQNDHDCK